MGNAVAASRLLCRRGLRATAAGRGSHCVGGPGRRAHLRRSGLLGGSAPGGQGLMANYELTAPVTEDAVRKLRVDDTVTLNGTLFGIRDATQIHMFDRGRK